MKKLVLMAIGILAIALTGCGEAPVEKIEPEGVEEIEIETIEVKGIEVEPITVTCGNTTYWAD